MDELIFSEHSTVVVRRCSSKLGVLKALANYTGKHLCWSLILKELQEKDSNTGAFL